MLLLSFYYKNMVGAENNYNLVKSVIFSLSINAISVKNDLHVFFYI